MKKIFKGLTCALVGCVLAVSATGCKQQSDHRDAESSPLKLAIGAVDQKFNPLFYTSANDGTIANLTQVSLVTADLKKKDTVLAFGQDYPTATLDYKETYYSSSGDVLGTGYGDGRVSGRSDADGYTTYEFLIKNDMKFSDGEPLTIMDILFNMYVYLDPVYSGSNTMYSTKIKGLQAYRQQDLNVDEDLPIDMTVYYGEALKRINDLIEWSKSPSSIKLSEAQEKDLAKVKELFADELDTDWNATAAGWVESYKEYRFEEAWQAFYYLEGLVGHIVEMNDNGVEVEKRDENNKYLTNIDFDSVAPDRKEDLINEMLAATSSEKIQAYLADPKNAGATEEDAKLALQKAHAVEHVYNAYTSNTQIKTILTSTATASTAYDYFALDALSQANKGDLAVPSISGIQVAKSKEFNNKTYEQDHDILKITINGIDPKARWNFGITIAPMHYYSDEEHYNAAMKDYNEGKIYDGTATNFGVKYRDINWFSSVLADPDKNGLPLGAGPYQCSTDSFSTTGVNKITFFKNNVAYFTRNENFKTMGTKIENAKIKNVQYKVYRDDKIVEALKTKEIDYGEPTATSDNQRELNTGTLKQIKYLTGGYGYIGINPKYVEDLEVRQAIMHAFDTSSIVEYYGQSLVNLINAPTSTTSWAYPENYERTYAQWTNPNDIMELVEQAGWEKGSDGVYQKNGKRLKISFVIAGESNDHPAYQMMVKAQSFLKQCGFDISVETRIDALKRLTTGDLEVWAAAWSTSIDPDPYQIYSIYSNATSTKNWNKEGIMSDGGTGKFAREYKIVNDLNKLIADGRGTLNQTDRAEIYKQCYDNIMALAVEFPTYQRYDLCIYNSAVLDRKSMHASDASYVMGPISELWKVNYVK